MTDRTKQETIQDIQEVMNNMDEVEAVPAGYITIELSTKGKLGCAPAKFHVKNFSTESLLDLTMLEQREAPLKIPSVLDELIWEKDVSVKNFNEKEVIETLIEMYRNFYSPTIQNLLYKPTDKDWEFLAKKFNGVDSDAYRRSRREYDLGEWKPTFSVDLNRIHKFDIPDNPKLTLSITKRNGFSCKYSIPKYGDYIIASSYIERKWSNKDKQFEQIARMVQFEEESWEKLRQGDKVVINSIPKAPKSERDKLLEYQREKSKDVTRILKVLRLVEVNGEDVSQMPLDERFERFADDPNIDVDTFKKIQIAWNKQKFGIDENIMVLNPVTGKEELYEYPFQVDTLLSTFFHDESDSTTIEFE